MNDDNKVSEIWNFRKEYYFLSNFYKCEFRYNGVWYSTSEAAYQASKTTDFDEKNKIALMDAVLAKRCGRKVDMRDDFESKKKNFMVAIVICKFTQNDYLIDKLLNTGDTKLIEGNLWHDNYWGVCNCGGKNCTGGKNMLGKILMTVRRMARECPDRLQEWNEKYSDLYDF